MLNDDRLLSVILAVVVLGMFFLGAGVGYLFGGLIA